MCGSAPSAPQLPAYPDLTSAQQQNLGQQGGVSGQFGNVIQGVSGQLGNNQNILQQISGLFNSDGSINQNAVTQLQQMAGNQTGAAGQAGQSALSGLGSTQSALGATSSAYQNALQGNVPQNQQLQFQQNQSFQQMQEQAAQQGIKITGTGFNDAVSDSTAGQKLIQNFQQNANIQNQNYALGYTQQLAGNMGQLAGAGQTQAATGQGLSTYSQMTPLTYLGQSITGGQSALSPLLSSYQNQLSSAYSPLYQQQIGPYQDATAQAYANYQGAMGQYNGFNQLLSSYLNPIGGAGGTLGGSAMGSMGGLFGGSTGGAGLSGAGSVGAAAGVGTAGSYGAGSTLLPAALSL
jgi:hypothetical protein